MVGLRTQESEKFEKFFSIVQTEARKKGCVFFGDAGQGKVFENEQIECEDLCGWLVPITDADEFQKLFEEDSDELHNYDDLYCYVDFEVNPKTGKITIDIDDTPNDLIVDDFNIIKNNVILK